MKKIVKIFAILIFFVGGSIILASTFYIGSEFVKFSSLQVDTNALNVQKLDIPVYDNLGDKILDTNSFSYGYVKLREMPSHTYNAFISIEDKGFYKHKGIDLKRMAIAGLKNIKTLSFKEGASTISQQLIKNTHLSSKKTIERKINEITLTLKMEKMLSKEEILESYLNVIYFGNNCYGLKQASYYYFSKQPKDLSLSESALLAGIIKSPKKYCPISQEKNALSRRNLVLKEMFSDKKITEAEFLQAKNEGITLNIGQKKENRLNSYTEASIEEASRILNLPAKQIALAGLKIHTYQNKDEQKKLESSLKILEKNDYAGLALDVKTHGYTAYLGKSAYKILDAKRQPGSTIKPVLVYGPALNEDIISPETQILDEKLKIGEYEPENVGGKFSGYVSAREALSRSINIPAVKILSYVGTNKAKYYAEKMGIEFDRADTSYSLALGGMTWGASLSTLVSAYSTFACGGKFDRGRFVSYIERPDGKVIYKHNPVEKTVLRNDACYLLTDMLKTASTSGTSKKLKELNIEIASKTGTVGKKNSKQNTDAWNISYTPSKVLGIWTGNLDNRPIDIAGGNEPTECVKKFFKGVKNEEFVKPDEVVFRDIDLIDLKENHKITLASSLLPDRYKKRAMFSIFNLPEISESFCSEIKIDAKGVKNNNKNYVILKPKKYVEYYIFDENKKLLNRYFDESEEKKFEVKSKNILIKAKYFGQEKEYEKELKFS